MSKPPRPSKRRTAEQTRRPHELRKWCDDCSKWSYVARDHTSDERRRLRRGNPSGQPVRVYSCPIEPTRWHVGHDIVSAEAVRHYYAAHGVAMGDK